MSALMPSRKEQDLRLECVRLAIAARPEKPVVELAKEIEAFVVIGTGFLIRPDADFGQLFAAVAALAERRSRPTPSEKRGGSDG